MPTTHYIYEVDVEGEKAVRAAKKLREDLQKALEGPMPQLAEYTGQLRSFQATSRSLTTALEKQRIAVERLEGQWKGYLALLDQTDKKIEGIAATWEKQADRIIQSHARIVDSARWMYQELVGGSLIPELRDEVEEAYAAMGRAAQAFYSSLEAPAAFRQELVVEWRRAVRQYEGLYFKLARLVDPKRMPAGVAAPLGPAYSYVAGGAVGRTALAPYFVEERDLQLAERVLRAAADLLTGTGMGRVIAAARMDPRITVGMGVPEIVKGAFAPGVRAEVATGIWEPARRHIWVGILDELGETVSHLEALRTLLHESGHAFSFIARAIHPAGLREIYQLLLRPSLITAGRRLPPPQRFTPELAEQLEEVLADSIEALGSRLLGVPPHEAFRRQYWRGETGPTYQIGLPFVTGQLWPALERLSRELLPAVEALTREEYMALHGATLAGMLGGRGYAYFGTRAALPAEEASLSLQRLSTAAEQTTRALVPMTQVFRGVGLRPGEPLRLGGRYWATDIAAALPCALFEEELETQLSPALTTSVGRVLTAYIPTMLRGVLADWEYDLQFPEEMEADLRRFGVDVPGLTKRLETARELYAEGPVFLGPIPEAYLSRVRQMSPEELRRVLLAAGMAKGFAYPTRYREQPLALLGPEYIEAVKGWAPEYEGLTGIEVAKIVVPWQHLVERLELPVGEAADSLRLLRSAAEETCTALVPMAQVYRGLRLPPGAAAQLQPPGQYWTYSVQEAAGFASWLDMMGPDDRPAPPGTRGVVLRAQFPATAMPIISGLPAELAGDLEDRIQSTHQFFMDWRQAFLTGIRELTSRELTRELAREEAWWRERGWSTLETTTRAQLEGERAVIHLGPPADAAAQGIERLTASLVALQPPAERVAGLLGAPAAAGGPYAIPRLQMLAGAGPAGAWGWYGGIGYTGRQWAAAGGAPSGLGGMWMGGMGGWGGRLPPAPPMGGDWWDALYRQPPPPQPPLWDADELAGLAPSRETITRWDLMGDAINQATMQYFGLRRIGYGLESVGRGLDYFGQATIDTLQQAAANYLTFELAATRASAAMELDIELHEELEDAILGQAIALAIFEPEEMAEGLRLWAAGLGEVVTSEEQLNRMLQDTVSIQQLAYMNNVQLGESVNTVGGIMHEYGIKVDNVSRVTEVLNFVAARTYANVDDLGQAFLMVGPVAASVGDDFETTAAMMALLSDENLKGTKVGRALRQMYIQMLDPSREHEETMNRLLSTYLEMNQTWKDVVFPQGEFIGGAKYIDLLAAATENLTEAERNEALAIIATANELPTLISLVNQQIVAREEGVNVVRAYEKLITGAIDGEVRAYARLMEEITGVPVALEDATTVWMRQMGIIEAADWRRAERIKLRWDAVSKSMGKAVADIAVPALDQVTRRLVEIMELADRYPVLKPIAATAGLLIGALSSTAGKLTVFGGQLAGLISNYLIFARAVQIYSAAQTEHAAAMAAHSRALYAASAAPAGGPAVVPAPGGFRGPAWLPGLLRGGALVGLWEMFTFHWGAGAMDWVQQYSEEAQKRFFELFYKEPEIAAFAARGAEGEAVLTALGDAVGEDINSFQEFQLVMESLGYVTTTTGDRLTELGTDLLTVEDVIATSPAGRVIAQMRAGEGWTADLYPEIAPPAVGWGVSPEDEQEALLRFLEFQDALAELEQEGEQRREDIWQNYWDFVEDGTARLERSIVRAQADFDFQTLRRQEDLERNIQRARDRAADRAADYAEAWRERQIELRKTYHDQLAEMEEDFQKRMARMYLDHIWAMEDLIRERDARGVLLEMRNYARRKREAEEDHADEMGRQGERYQESFRKAEEAYKKQQKQLQEQLDEQIKTLEENFEFAEKRRQEDFDRRIDRMIEDWEYQKELRRVQRDEELEALKQWLEDQRIELEDAAGEEIAILLDLITDREAYLRGHYATVLTDLEEFLFGESGFVDRWHQACMATQEELEAMGALLESWPEWWSEFLAGRPLAETPPGYTPYEWYPMQAGGYAGRGIYLLGEAGREFVLNAATTRALEHRLGTLTQRKLLGAGGVSITVDQGGWLFQGSFTEADKLWFAETAREQAMRGVLEVIEGVGGT